MPTEQTRVYSLLILIALCSAVAGPASALDHVTLRRDGREIQVDGRLLVTAQDGGLLMLAADGVLWAVPPEEQIHHTADDTPFEPLSPEAMAERLLDELPDGFDVHHTAHYVIGHDTSRVYAQWCGALFERLYRGFTNYWSRRGFKLHEPEFPLVAIVFADRNAYAKFSQPELGDAAGSIIGYFSLRTNRMTMYDLTGIETLNRYGTARGTTAQISQILAQPDAQRTVATVVHEATHQIAFNCGLHTRYSDCPVWFSEGIAVYFETPDLGSTKGWRSIGTVNGPRLLRFHQYLAGRPANSLETLIADDKRFRDPDQAQDAYAEAWALTYFLIRQRPSQYVAYLELLSQKKPLLNDGPQGRLKEFQKTFGDWRKLDAEFLRYMTRVR
ncbi:MAG: DUF1570 domain-containing protein [Pirellulales bacterium]|nr:DUF1570 domain-containing protein [Pirellulales bacterium]